MLLPDELARTSSAATCGREPGSSSVRFGRLRQRADGARRASFAVRSASGEARDGETRSVHGVHERPQPTSNKASGRYGEQSKGGEPFPGTCGESLWLLPSGPDQVHDAAMRGDPPLIGCACGAEYRLSAIAIIAASERFHSASRCSADRPQSACRYNRPHRRSFSTLTQRHAIDSSLVAPLPSQSCWALPSAAGIALLPDRSRAGRAPLPLRPQKSKELVVLVRPGPAFYFPGPDGALTGFDVDLARSSPPRRSFRCGSPWPTPRRR